MSKDLSSGRFSVKLKTVNKMKENKQGNLMDFLLEIEPSISKHKPKPKKLTEKERLKSAQQKLK